MGLGGCNSAKDLTRILNVLRDAAIYDIFAQTCLHEFIKKSINGECDLDDILTNLPEGKITLRVFLETRNMLSPLYLVETKRNANRALVRNLIKETFRITQSYCTNSSQYDKLENMEWYQFTRLMVNSLSHDFRWEFRSKDEKFLPVEYKGISIQLDQKGRNLQMKLQTMVDLVDEIIEFTKSDII